MEAHSILATVCIPITEATDYFSPHNFGGALGGATVTCYVYLPPGLAPGRTFPGYIRVFVKDTQYRNDFSDAITIGPSTVGRWVRLSFVIGANLNNEDRGFDATQVSAIGVRVDLNNGSALKFYRARSISMRAHSSVTSPASCCMPFMRMI